MSMNKSEDPAIFSALDFDAPRLRWDTALACYSRECREELGLSLERAAELAGLELSEWCALESGWVPDDMATLQAIAATLQTSWADYSFLALMADCQQHADQSRATREQ
jgi:transcriptional regulator with XRE-family HTH domain